MIFVINKLKYDTDHMTLVSYKCKCSYEANLLGNIVQHSGENVKLWISKKGNWLLTYEDTSYRDCGTALSSEEAADYLMTYDLEAYEKHFGPLEEA